MRKARPIDIAMLPIIPAVFVAWYGIGTARAIYGIGRALVKGKVYSESQR